MTRTKALRIASHVVSAPVRVCSRAGSLRYGEGQLMTRYVRPSLLAALWLACWLALCVACTASDGQTGMEQPACPDGREWTEWCGCEPPIYGDDC